MEVRRERRRQDGDVALYVSTSEPGGMAGEPAGPRRMAHGNGVGEQGVEFRSAHGAISPLSYRLQLYNARLPVASLSLTLLLGVLLALTPLGTDTYTPALPAMPAKNAVSVRCALVTGVPRSAAIAGRAGV